MQSHQKVVINQHLEYKGQLNHELLFYALTQVINANLDKPVLPVDTYPINIKFNAGVDKYRFKQLKLSVPYDTRDITEIDIHNLGPAQGYILYKLSCFHPSLAAKNAYFVSLPDFNNPRDVKAQRNMLVRLTAPVQRGDIYFLDPAKPMDDKQTAVFNALVNKYILPDGQEGHLPVECVYTIDDPDTASANSQAAQTNPQPKKVLLVNISSNIARYQRKNHKNPTAGPEYRYAVQEPYNSSTGASCAGGPSKVTLRSQADGSFLLWNKEPNKQRFMKKISGNTLIDHQTLSANEFAKREARFYKEFNFFAATGPTVNKAFNESILITRYMNGFDLYDLIALEKKYRKPIISLSERAKLLQTLCVQFAEIHKKKILHRDAKPENIRLLQTAPVGRQSLEEFLKNNKLDTTHPRIFDFGLARFMNEPVKEGGCGTALYVASECWQQAGSTTKTDVFSLLRLGWEVMGCYYLDNFEGFVDIRNYTLNPHPANKLPGLCRDLPLNYAQEDIDAMEKLFVAGNNPDPHLRPLLLEAAEVFGEVAKNSQEPSAAPKPCT